MKTVIKDRSKKVSFDNPALAVFVESRRPDTRIPQRIALIDQKGNIVAVNQAWIALAERTGAPLNRAEPGVNYLEACRNSADTCQDSRRALAGIDTVLKGRSSSFAMDYTCDTPSGPIYLRMTVTALDHGDIRAAIAYTDITDLQLSKEEDCRRLQQFARRLINAQEVERQRIGREIHDDIGNRIALMSLSVREFLKQAPENFRGNAGELHKVIREIDDLSTALRNLSHMLHSPALRYLGVGGALKSLQEVFEKTYGIRVSVVIPAMFPRLPDEVELCVFRVSQECLQNIAKHSGADRARIVLKHTNKQIQLTITDTGRGFDPGKAVQDGGLGLLSMEERALSLRGQLTVNSSRGGGTEVRLTIPLQKAAASFTAR